MRVANKDVGWIFYVGLVNAKQILLIWDFLTLVSKKLSNHLLLIDCSEKLFIKNIISNYIFFKYLKIDQLES